ncbi:MAG TPA: GNAT family N-acetyltransferase [Sphingomicrobium sp.]|nr:GNAT family N-acetyltransferase [Sphingomicrobium sp.]
MTAVIRLAMPADAGPIAAIYAPYCTDSRISFEEVAPDPEEMARRIVGDRPGFHPWFVAEEEEGAILGYAASSPFRTRPAYRWSVETGIYLAPDAQGRGIGRALLETLLGALERQGYVCVIAAIALPNPASVALHEKLGFEQVGAYRGTGFKQGQWLDVGLWQKDLAARPGAPAEPLPYAGLPDPVTENSR